MITEAGVFCDRCGMNLAGYGVLFGLVCSDLDPDDAVRELIYCYACRDTVLAGLLTSPSGNRKICTTCAEPVVGVAEAMMCADTDPATSDTRFLVFCYRNGHRDQLLAQGAV